MAEIDDNEQRLHSRTANGTTTMSRVFCRVKQRTSIRMKNSPVAFLGKEQEDQKTRLPPDLVV